MTQKAQEYYSTSEAAKLLGVSRVTVFLWIEKGKIQAKKVGRNYIIPRTALLPLLKKGGLSDAGKAMIDRAVKKSVQEYGETFKLLANA